MTGSRRISPILFKKIVGRPTQVLPEISFAVPEITLNRWGAGSQIVSSLSVSVPPTSPITVSLSSSDPSITVSPTSVTFGPDSPLSVNFSLAGMAIGPDQAIITATASEPGIASKVMTVNRPPFGLPVTDGLKLWLSADRGLMKSDGTNATIDQESVAQWLDYSGQNQHLNQLTGTAQPKLRTSYQNSLPGIQFDGSNDCLEFDSTLNLNDLSIYWIGKMLEYPTNESALFHGTAASYAANNYSNGLYWFQGADIVSGANGSFYPNTPYKIALIRTGSTWQLNVNGSDKQVNGLSNTAIIKGFGKAYSGYSNMVLNEFIVFSRKLSVTENNSIQNYLSRWGI